MTTTELALAPPDAVEIEAMDAWAPGERNLFIVITPQSVTGRMVRA